MSLEILVENVKCGGCANSIRRQLLDLDGVEGVDVDVAEGKVHVVTGAGVDEESLCGLAVQKLQKLGYPQVGSVDGLRAKGAKAKSFVSCAVGKLTD